MQFVIKFILCVENQTLDNNTTVCYCTTELAHNTLSKLCNSALKSYIKIKLTIHLQCCIHIYSGVCYILHKQPQHATIHKRAENKQHVFFTSKKSMNSATIYSDLGLFSQYLTYMCSRRSCIKSHAHTRTRQVLITNMVLHKDTNCNTKKNATSKCYIITLLYLSSQ